MKQVVSGKKGIGLILLSLALLIGCNINNSETEGVTITIILRGRVFDGETGKVVPNAVITIYETERTGDGEYEFRDYERATATTDHYGNYHLEGIIKSCHLDKTAGRILAVKSDPNGGFISYMDEFKCSERLQTRNLILRRTGYIPGLIIR